MQHRSDFPEWSSQPIFQLDVESRWLAWPAPEVDIQGRVVSDDCDFLTWLTCPRKVKNKTRVTSVHYCIFLQQRKTLRWVFKTSRHSHPSKEEPCINLGWGGGGTDHILGQLNVRPCYSGSPDSPPPTSAPLPTLKGVWLAYTRNPRTSRS